MRDLNQQKSCLSVCLSGLDIVYRVTEFYDLGEEKPPAHIGHLRKINQKNYLIMEEHIGLYIKIHAIKTHQTGSSLMRAYLVHGVVIHSDRRVSSLQPWLAKHAASVET